MSRRLRKDNSDKTLRSMRAPLESTRSAKDLHGGSAAGQFTRTSSRKRMFDNVYVQALPESTTKLKEYSMPAGIVLNREDSPLINSRDTDHVKKLIKSRENSRPLKESDTSYNRQYSRGRLSPCHTPERPKDCAPKLAAPEGPFQSARRHPYEVKSSLR